MVKNKATAQMAVMLLRVVPTTTSTDYSVLIHIIPDNIERFDVFKDTLMKSFFKVNSIVMRFAPEYTNDKHGLILLHQTNEDMATTTDQGEIVERMHKQRPGKIVPYNKGMSFGVRVDQVWHDIGESDINLATLNLAVVDHNFTDAEVVGLLWAEVNFSFK